MSKKMDMDMIVAHLRKVNGLEPGDLYDPAVHDDVPALCFGVSVASNRLVGDGAHLDPARDLVAAAASKIGAAE